MSDRVFPIHPYSMRDEKWFPRSVPWAKIEQAERRAQRNHSQTLERLAERGGLAPSELWLVYLDKDLVDMRTMTPADQLDALYLVLELNGLVPVKERP